MTPFDAVAQALEKKTKLTRTQARGTLRLLCRELGVPTDAASRADMQLLLTRGLLPALEARHVAVPTDLMQALGAALASASEGGAAALYGMFDDLD